MFFILELTSAFNPHFPQIIPLQLSTCDVVISVF